MRQIVSGAERCVVCADGSLICPVKVFDRWEDLSEDRRQRISKLSLEERQISFANAQSAKAAKRAEQLAAKVFAYFDLESCLGETCKQCSDSCWKVAITVTKREN